MNEKTIACQLAWVERVLDNQGATSEEKEWIQTNIPVTKRISMTILGGVPWGRSLILLAQSALAKENLST